MKYTKCVSNDPVKIRYLCVPLPGLCTITSDIRYLMYIDFAKELVLIPGSSMVHDGIL